MIIVNNTEKYFRDNNPVLVTGKIYNSTDKDKFKIGSGAKWSVTDYEKNFLILRSTGLDRHLWKYTADDTGMPSLPGEDLGV